MNAPARPAEEVQAMAALGWHMDREGDYALPSHPMGSPSAFILAPYWDECQSARGFRADRRWTFLDRSGEKPEVAFDDPISAAIYLAIEQSNN